MERSRKPRKPARAAKQTAGSGAKPETKPSRPGDKPGTWIELADVIVSFGYTLEGGGRRLITKAYHSQQDREAQWVGVPREELLDWIVEEAGSSLPPNEAGTPAARMAAPPGPQIEITDLRLKVSPGQPGAAPQAHSEAMIRASGRVRVSHPEPASTAGGDTVKVELQLVDLHDGEAHPAARTFVTVEKEDPVKAFEADFAVPSPGRYRVDGVATVLSAGTMVRSEGPLLRVEPQNVPASHHSSL